MRTEHVVVEEYDAGWPRQFEELRSRIWPVIADIADRMEHVGSTSVPGLAAKPIIDIDIVIRSRELLPEVIDRLATLGARHRGDLGIDGREAFEAIPGSVPHHLYVCASDNLALNNHLVFRDCLRSNDAARDRYAELKRGLAAKYPKSIDDYIEGKTDFVLRVLAMQGFLDGDLAVIRAVNRAGAL